MEYKKIFWSTIALLLLVILALGLFIWSADVYGIRDKVLVSGVPERIYNAITARDMDYNAAIFGSSVSENFKCSELDQFGGVKSMKFTLQGGSVTERAYIWDYVCRQRELKFIITDITFLAFTSPKNSFEIDRNFYETDHLPWSEYFSSENLKVAVKKVFRGERGKTNRDDLYSWFRNYKFGKMRLAQLYFNKDTTALPPAKEVNMEVLRDNLENRFLPTVRRYMRPDCRVVIFFPPYSILQYHPADIDRSLEVKRVIMEELLKVDGLILLDFQAAEEVVCNLDNYRDDIHYSEKINSWIIQQLDSPRFRVTPDRIDQLLDRHRKLVESYNYTATYDELSKLLKR